MTAREALVILAAGGLVYVAASAGQVEAPPSGPRGNLGPLDGILVSLGLDWKDVFGATYGVTWGGAFGTVAGVTTAGVGAIPAAGAGFGLGMGFGRFLGSFIDNIEGLK